MIYRCPKCNGEISFEESDCVQYVRCGCGAVQFDAFGNLHAKDIIRMIDSERWRKISEEPPEEGEGYSHVLCRVEFGKLYELSFAEVKQIIDSIDVDMYPNAEWRPVYGF